MKNESEVEKHFVDKQGNTIHVVSIEQTRTNSKLLSFTEIVHVQVLLINDVRYNATYMSNSYHNMWMSEHQKDLIVIREHDKKECASVYSWSYCHYYHQNVDHEPVKMKTSEFPMELTLSNVAILCGVDENDIDFLDSDDY